jgi:predicted nucleic acid-binding Zn ribbon protein
MPPPIEPPVGRVFGRLTVLGLSAARPNGQRAWDCRCACDGKVIPVPVRILLHAGKKSCGCTLAERHANARRRTARALPASRPCSICGTPFAPQSGHAMLCGSDVCRRAYHRRWKQVDRHQRPPRPPRNCVVCGAAFIPDRKNRIVCSAVECRAQHKRNLANSLNQGRETVGSILRTCVVCESPFPGHFHALTCSRPCRLARRREQDRQLREASPPQCIVCGVTLLWRGNDRYTCGPVCREVAYRRRQRRGYLAHPEHRETQVEKHRRRLDLDAEYRARVQERERRLRARKQAATFATEAAHLTVVLQARSESLPDSEEPAHEI